MASDLLSFHPRRKGKTHLMHDLQNLMSLNHPGYTTLCEAVLSSLANPDVRYSMRHAKGLLVLKGGRVLHDGGDPELAAVARFMSWEWLRRARCGYVLA